MTEWQDIESAQKDGTGVLLAVPMKDGEWLYVTGWWYVPPEWRIDDAGWETKWGFPGDVFEPTHWMPLPEPPKTDDEPQRFDEYGNYGENNPPLPETPK